MRGRGGEGGFPFFRGGRAAWVFRSQQQLGPFEHFAHQFPDGMGCWRFSLGAGVCGWGDVAARCVWLIWLTLYCTAGTVLLYCRTAEWHTEYLRKYGVESTLRSTWYGLAWPAIAICGGAFLPKQASPLVKLGQPLPAFSVRANHRPHYLPPSRNQLVSATSASVYYVYITFVRLHLSHTCPVSSVYYLFITLLQVHTVQQYSPHLSYPRPCFSPPLPAPSHPCLGAALPASSLLVACQVRCIPLTLASAGCLPTSTAHEDYQSLSLARNCGAATRAPRADVLEYCSYFQRRINFTQTSTRRRRLLGSRSVGTGCELMTLQYNK